MVYEDLRTFTEQDVANRWVQTRTRNTATGLRFSDFDHCVYKDYGAGHFDDVEHQLNCKVTAAGNSSQMGIYVITDVLGDQRTDHFVPPNAPEIYIMFSQTGAGVLNLSCGYVVQGTWNDAVWGCALNTDYYLTVDRVDVLWRMKVYSDAARTIQVATRSVACATTAWRYLMCGQSYGWLGIGAESGWSENYDLAPLAPEVEPPMGFNFKMGIRGGLGRPLLGTGGCSIGG